MIKPREQTMETNVKYPVDGQSDTFWKLTQEVKAMSTEYIGDFTPPFVVWACVLDTRIQSWSASQIAWDNLNFFYFSWENVFSSKFQFPRVISIKSNHAKEKLIINFTDQTADHVVGKHVKRKRLRKFM